MSEMMTVDAFRAAAKDGAALGSSVYRLATSDPQEVATESRTLRFVFSDGTIDRVGDTIDAGGWEIADFLKNPVALWAHCSDEPPIGRAKNVGQVGDKLMGDIEFMDAETSAFADSIFRMVKGGFIKAVSVGFSPLEWTFTNDKDRPFGIDFKRQELLEISVCPVPCNQNALLAARAKGINTKPVRDWAAKVLDSGGFIWMPRPILERLFNEAKTPEATRKQYLEGKETFEIRDMSEAGDGAAIVPAGNCGRAEDMQCGMIDPAECAIHFANAGKAASPGKIEKAGRRISQANADLLTKAVGHIQSVIDSNEPESDPADPKEGNEPGESGEVGSANDPANGGADASHEFRAKLRERARALAAKNPGA